MASGLSMTPSEGALMVYRRLNSTDQRFAVVEKAEDGTFWRVHSRAISLRGTSEGWCMWTVRSRGLFLIEGVPGTFEVLGFILPPSSEMAA